MIDFPQNPVNGQVFTSGGQSWMWDGVKWVPNGSIATMVVPMNDNRIINGDMRIDQRNNGAASQAINAYTIDRWYYQAAQAAKISWVRQTGTGLSPFPYCINLSSVSAYTSLAADYFNFAQYIEADQISDFAWGTTGAQPVTLSFWAYSSLNGMFSGSLCNDAGNRSYPFSFLLPTVNTWTRIVINIPGDTAGTWVMSGNARAAMLRFDLGSGANFRGSAGAWVTGNIIGVTGAVSVVASNAANLLLTGVKLEIGSIATPYNRQSLAKSLADCQRYFEVCQNYINQGNFVTGANYTCTARFKVEKRIAPTITLTDLGNNGFPAGAPSSNTVTTDGMLVAKVCNATLSNAYYQFSFTASAEL